VFTSCQEFGRNLGGATRRQRKHLSQKRKTPLQAPQRRFGNKETVIA